MADFFKRRDVQSLLKYRKILFLGDSNVRPLYKDLVSSLKLKGLINVETLKNPNVDSYFGDIAIQQCGRKHEWNFWENRIFEEGPWRVELFCTGRVLTREIQQYLFKLSEVPSSMPDIVYVSYNFSHGKNTRNLVLMVLASLKMQLPCTTLVLFGSPFATARDMFGGPRFDEVPFFSASMSSREVYNEDDVAGKVESLGFHYLNIAHYLHNDLFRGMTTEPWSVDLQPAGWEAVFVRYSTFLLLTYISNSLLMKTPGRVNQDVLQKAIASVYDERQLYHSLLLKHANDWLGVKTNVMTEVIDSVGSNAREVTQMLWKIHHRGRVTAERKQDSDKKHNEIGAPTDKENILDASNHSTDVGSAATVTPTIDMEFRDDCENIRAGQDSSANRGQWRAVGNSLSSRKDPANARSPIGAVGNFADSSGDLASENGDDESLEEGEIRSPVRSPEKRLATQNQNSAFSDISSSEDETEANIFSSTSEPLLFHSVSSQNYQHFIPNHADQNYIYRNLPNTIVQNRSGTANIDPINLSPNPVVTIEVSDDEPIPEETFYGKCNNADEAIVNLNSDDDTDYHEKITLRPSRTKLRPPSEGERRKLVLKKTDESVTSWPVGIASSGRDRLWKWWRNHIEGNDGSLELNRQGMPPIRATIPGLHMKTGTNIAVPKIIDDLREFLDALSQTKFPPERVVDVNEGSTKQKAVKPVTTRRLLPLAEELSRGSVKKINFEISHKKKPLTTCNRITIKDFASIRNLAVVSKKNSHSDLNENSSYYSYGEQMKSGLPFSCRGWHPLGAFAPSTSKATGESSYDQKRIGREGRSPKDNTVQKRRRDSSSSSTWRI